MFLLNPQEVQHNVVQWSPCRKSVAWFIIYAVVACVYTYTYKTQAPNLNNMQFHFDANEKFRSFHGSSYPFPSTSNGNKWAVEGHKMTLEHNNTRNKQEWTGVNRKHSKYSLKDSFVHSLVLCTWYMTLVKDIGEYFGKNSFKFIAFACFCVWKCIIWFV